MPTSQAETEIEIMGVRYDKEFFRRIASGNFVDDLVYVKRDGALILIEPLHPRRVFTEDNQ